MGFIIPTIIVAADQYVQHPDVILATGKWPHIPHIVNAMDHDIHNHPWFQLVKSEKKVDKGKGKAVEVSRENTVEGSSGMMAMEVDKPGAHIGEPVRPLDSPALPEGPKGESSHAITGDESCGGRSRS